MSFFHGVRTGQNETSASSPITAASGIPFVVGTAPIHTVENGKVNVPILCNTYAEAVEALGYSDDWKKYTLCEMVYSQFKLYGMSPIIVVNVLDPEQHKTSVEAAAMTVVDKQIKLPFEAINSSVKVSSAVDAATEYELDKDFVVFYQADALIIEVTSDGAAKDEKELTVAYDAVDVSQITKDDIIGGVDTNTKAVTGFELIDQVFPRFLIVPDLLLAPGWSHDSEVAAIMATKAEAINGVFKDAKALIDVDCSVVKHYSDIQDWRTANGLTNKADIVLWPNPKLGDRTFHFSVQAAGLMAKVDSDNGCPCESPSNKQLKADALVLDDGTEVVLDITQANYLNSIGIVTALNFMGGFVLWGNYTACYPTNTDIKDYMIPVSRMFSWVANTVVLTYWSKTDRKMTRRLIDSIIDSLNIWLNGLVADEKLLGGRVEFRDSENPTTDLMAGIIRFHLYITPPSPAQEIDFVQEYDVSYVQQALAA